MSETPRPLSYLPADRSAPVLETTVGDALRRTATAYPDRLALVEGTADPAGRRRWIYAALLSEAEQLARALLARFAPGEHVAIWAPNSAEWVLLEYASGLAGITLVTVNPALKESEAAYVLGQSESVGVFLVPEYRGVSLQATLEAIRPTLPRLREVVLFTELESFVALGSPQQALPPAAPDAIAQIQYTSGTTGFPKGALLHHRGLTNNARLFAQRLGATPDDVWVNPMPLFHTAGCVMATLGCVQTGGTHVVVPGFDPALVLNLIEAERGSLSIMVPTMLIALMEHADLARRDHSSLRALVTGGAPVAAELVQGVEAAFGAPLTTVFAQTEASPVITQTLPSGTQQDRFACGVPLPQTEVKIADPVTGETVPTGTIGEICTRGYHVMRGYFNLPEQTAQAIDAEGWLHTGDLGTLDEHGHCRVEGRLKDMIIRGGENIYPREIEAVLFAHPGIADASVVGVPDPYWGEQVAAFIRPATDPSPSQKDLEAYVLERLARYKRPRHWIFVDRFPQTASGKIQKFVLREQFVREQAATVMSTA
jgi:fatty-acyl-CoA synthase